MYSTQPVSYTHLCKPALIENTYRRPSENVQFSIHLFKKTTKTFILYCTLMKRYCRYFLQFLYSCLLHSSQFKNIFSYIFNLTLPDTLRNSSYYYKISEDKLQLPTIILLLNKVNFPQQIIAKIESEIMNPVGTSSRDVILRHRILPQQFKRDGLCQV